MNIASSLSDSICSAAHGFSVRAAAAVLLLLGFSGAEASGKNVILYDAETGVGRGYEKDGSFVVDGEWDLSGCGNLEIEFDSPLVATGSVQADVVLENANATLPTPERASSRGVYKFSVNEEATSQFLHRPIPPSMPELQEVVSRMVNVRASGLFDLVWPSVRWGQKGGRWGDRISCWTLDPSRVVRATVTLHPPAGKRAPKVRRIMALGPANVVSEMPAFAKIPADEFFPFVDAYGQFKWREWPGKIHSDADLAAEREREDADLAAHPGPKGRDKWGGWEDGPKFEATGHFYVRKVDGKWWFVDPDGRLWWSHGPVRVSASCGMTPVKGRENHFEFLPKEDSPFAEFYRTRDELLWPYYVKRGCTNTYDFTSANLYRKYGGNWREVWADRTHRRLRSWGANTIANSSDARVTRLSRTPYCDRFEIKSRPLKGAEKVVAWWPFRDPFDPSFRENVRAQLVERRAELDDPWCFGLFVDNELQWGEAESLGRWTWESPDDQPAKIEFRKRLAAKGASEPADADFREFSLAIAQAYFSTVRDELKKAAPRKLYMGCRFSGAAEWVIRAAAPYVDVMSYNYYRRDLSGFDLLPSNIDKPVIIGEFHFGALDRGPIRAGLIQLKDQAERGATYRRYLESTLRDRRIVGAHWHQYSDDVPTGRFDGENFQIGWVDVCDTPYAETIAAVRDIGERMYALRMEGDTYAEETVPGRAPSLLPAGKKFRLVWHDEFDGDALDASKWSFRTNFWGKRFPAFSDDGVAVSNSCAYLNLQKKGDQYCSPHLQTGELMWDIPHDPDAKGFWPLPKREPPKFLHKYGYYECRCRLQQHEGWWSAFWLQTPTQGVSLDARTAGLECDIMESFKPGEVSRHMLHRNGYGPDYRGYDSHRLGSAPTPEETARTFTKVDKTAFHTFGVLWETDGYTFFIDGKISGWKVGGGKGEAVSQAEQFILISTECKWYRQNKMTGKAVPELDSAIPDCFVVDHVRVFDVVK